MKKWEDINPGDLMEFQWDFIEDLPLQDGWGQRTKKAKLEDEWIIVKVVRVIICPGSGSKVVVTRGPHRFEWNWTKEAFNLGHIKFPECEPQNNDGRDTCYKCKRPTKAVDGIISAYSYCVNPGCKWFKN